MLPSVLNPLESGTALPIASFRRRHLIADRTPPCPLLSSSLRPARINHAGDIETGPYACGKLSQPCKISAANCLSISFARCRVTLPSVCWVALCKLLSSEYLPAHTPEGTGAHLAAVHGGLLVGVGDVALRRLAVGDPVVGRLHAGHHLALHVRDGLLQDRRPCRAFGPLFTNRQVLNYSNWQIECAFRLTASTGHDAGKEDPSRRQ